MNRRNWKIRNKNGSINLKRSSNAWIWTIKSLNSNWRLSIKKLINQLILEIAICKFKNEQIHWLGLQLWRTLKMAPSKAKYLKMRFNMIWELLRAASDISNRSQQWTTNVLWEKPPETENLTVWVLLERPQLSGERITIWRKLEKLVKHQISRLRAEIKN